MNDTSPNIYNAAKSRIWQHTYLRKIHHKNNKNDTTAVELKLKLQETKREIKHSLRITLWPSTPLHRLWFQPVQHVGDYSLQFKRTHNHVLKPYQPYHTHQIRRGGVARSVHAPPTKVSSDSFLPPPDLAKPRRKIQDNPKHGGAYIYAPPPA